MLKCLQELEGKERKEGNKEDNSIKCPYCGSCCIMIDYIIENDYYTCIDCGKNFKC